MSSAAQIVTRVAADPAPVLVIDTCSFLDLFRARAGHKEPLPDHDEIDAALRVTLLAFGPAPALHVALPELVPIEFRANADKVERDLSLWFRAHDGHQVWLSLFAGKLGIVAPAGPPTVPLSVAGALRRLAEAILRNASVMDRDLFCVERALERLIAERPPSHKKEIKDSINLEQALALSSAPRHGGLPNPVVFVSSNTSDFTESKQPGAKGSPLSDFAPGALEYFPTLRAALGSLQARRLIP